MSVAATAERRFEVLEELGRGSQTVTYRARLDGPDEGPDYAVKVLRRPADSTELARAFRREAALLASVNHPGIARVHQVGSWRGQPYMLMDLLEGQQLSRILADGPLPVAQLLTIGIDVGLALQAAHRVGVMHRDVKPDNILVGPDGVARVIDFGLAARLGEADEDDDTVSGTMLYIAPEQAGMLNRPVDGRADLYALGTVLYECATGEPPFRSSDVAELLRMHASTPVPDPRLLRPDLPPAVAAIITRLLAKDPDDRYQTAVGLVADLRRVREEPDTPLTTLGTQDAPTAADTMPPLVARETELSTLYSRWQRARAGRGGAVLVEGPTGVGKSRLAAELNRVVGATGVPVLAGMSDPDQSVPLAPLRSAIEAYVRRVLARPEPARSDGVASIVAAVGPARGLLGGLAPALGSIVDTPAVEEDDRQQQFTTAVAGFLAALARSSGGAVLHLDDVQWLDDATWAVLQNLAPELPRTPLLVVATARLDPACEAAMARLRSALGPALDTEVRLAELPVRAVGELISAVSGGLRLDEETAETMAARSDGNPFTLLQYLNAIVDSGLARPAWGHWLVAADELRGLRLPSSGRDLVVSRLDGLDERSRGVLGVAAVLGVRFSPGLLAEVSRSDDRRMWTVTGAAAARNLIERRDDGRYAFLHDQIREALLDQFDEASKRDVHERVAEVLDARAGRDAEAVYLRARHCQLAGIERDPVRMRRAGTEAGRLALADHAPDEALGYLSSAAAATELIGLEPDAGFLETLGVAQHRAGRFHDAGITLRLAHERAERPMDRARILGQIARLHDSAWNTAEQAASVDRALRELGRPLPTGRLRLVLSTLWWFLLGVLVGLTRIGYGTARGEQRDEYRLLTSLYDTAALANARQLRPTRSLVFSLRQVYPVNRLGPGPERVRMDIASAHLAQVVGWNRVAGRLTARAVRTAADLGDPRVQSYVAWLRAIDRYFFGADQGESIRATLVEQGRWLDPGQAGDLLLVIHWDTLLRGDLTAARELSEERAALLAGSNQPGRIAVHASRAGLLALQGDGTAAVAHLDRMRAERPDPLPWETVDILYGTMMAAVERFDLGPTFDRAADDLEALGLDQRLLVPSQLGLYVYLAYGRLEQARRAGPERRKAAVAAAGRAVRQLGRAANRPIMRAHHRVAEGALRQVRGRSAEALDELNASEPVLRAADAPLVAYEAARVRALALRELGVTGESARQARYAVNLAIEQGWPERTRRLAAEFGLTGADPDRADPRAPDGIGPLRYRQVLTAIEQVGLAASRVVDPDQVIAITLDETIRILGAERAFLFLPEHGQDAGESDRLLPQRGRDADGHDVDTPTGYSASVVERVRRTREPVVLTSTEEGAALGAQSVVLHGLRSVLAAPLLAEGRLLGLVYVDSRVARGMFSVDDAGVLTAITNHIAVALETARAAQLEVAVATANRQRDVAETVRDALAEITGHLGAEPVQVLRRLLGTARRVTHDDRAWLVLSTVDNAEQVQVIAGDRGIPSPMDTDAPLRALLGADGPVTDATSSDGARPALVGGLEHWLAVPLVAPRERLGLLLLASPEPTAFTQGRAEIVNALADKAVVAYENARLFEQVRRMATTDGLTGLANRSYLFESAERAFGAARRGGRRIAAMMIDVDHFKQVNDTYGHRIGDEVLAAMADRLRRAVRGHDLLGRYGGEEFAVVLVDATDDAHAAAERLREAVAASPVPTGVGPLDMTVSIGVAYQDDNDVTLSDMLARADLCLLGAKRAGRNRVRSA